jgi:hypothetical protein
MNKAGSLQLERILDLFGGELRWIILRGAAAILVSGRGLASIIGSRAISLALPAPWSSKRRA